MGYYNDISNSQYAAKDTALANRLNGVNGHTFLGTFLVGNVNNFLYIGQQLAGNGKSNESVSGPAPEVNTSASEERKNNAKNFRIALETFNKTPNKDNATALQNALKLCNNATNRAILDTCKKEHSGLFS